MKSLHRIPTTEYAYIEVEYEGSADEIVAQHRELYQKYHGGFGLETKEWNKLLDEYLNKGGMPSDLFPKLSKEQAWMIHELDKASARISNKK